MAGVGSILGGAFGVVRRRPGAVAVWGLTYILGSFAIMALMMLMIRGSVGTMGPPAEPSGGAIGGLLLFYLLYAFLAIVLINAVYRAILRPDETSFASMRVGADEFRMFGLTVVFVIGMMILYFITVLGGLLVSGIITAMLIQASEGLAVLVGAVLMLGFVGFWIWLSIRLSLIFPLTFYRRRFAIDDGWALGRGRFWTLFLSYLVVWIIVLAVFMLLFGSTFAAIIAAAGSEADPVARGEAISQMMGARAATGVAAMITMLLGSAVISLLSFVLGYGVIGSAARELLAEQGEVFDDEIEETARIFE